MKRPTKKEIKRAIKRDFPGGKLKYIEAVKLDSGIIVVEYETYTGHRNIKPGYTHVQRRLIVIDASGRYRSGDVMTSWWVKGRRR